MAPLAANGAKNAIGDLSVDNRQFPHLRLFERVFRVILHHQNLTDPPLRSLDIFLAIAGDDHMQRFIATDAV